MSNNRLFNYLFNLFVPKEKKSAFDIIIWNLKLKFLYVLFKDFLKLNKKIYLTILLPLIVKKKRDILYLYLDISEAYNIYIKENSELHNYIYELFMPKDKNKSVFGIIIWNLKLRFIYVLFKDFFKITKEFYLNIILPFMYNKFIKFLSRNIKDRKVFWLLREQMELIYNMLNFTYLRNWINYVKDMRQKQRTRLDTFFWKYVDWLEFCFKVVFLELYLFIAFVFNIFGYVCIYILIPKLFGSIVMDGFFLYIYWFFRFYLGKYIYAFWAKCYFYVYLWDVIYFVQKKFRGFYYINEKEKFLWWRGDIDMEKSFRSVLSGTDLDMDKVRVHLSLYFKHWYVIYFWQKVIIFIFYFFLFFYILIANIFLLIFWIFKIFKIIFLKCFNRPLVKYRYLLKKCR